MGTFSSEFKYFVVDLQAKMDFWNFSRQFVSCFLSLSHCDLACEQALLGVGGGREKEESHFCVEFLNAKCWLVDIEFDAYVIVLRVRRVDNTKMVAEFLFVKVARISLNNLGFLWNWNPSKVKLPMLYFKVAMFLQFYLRDLGQVWYFNLLQQLKV